MSQDGPTLDLRFRGFLPVVVDVETGGFNPRTDALLEVGGECLITADHGNAEQMLDPNGQPMTQHTTGPVNLVYVSQRDATIKEGSLCDVSPTLLNIMGLEQPTEMTGQSLLSFPE